MTLDLIAGVRPNFVKIAPLIHALQEARGAGDSSLRYRFIHTGQHYDAALSGAFLQELHLPTPDFYLEVGSGSHAQQTAAVLLAYERILQQAPRPDLCVVVGDVNSTLAAALAAKKCGVPVAHIEAGLRSFDPSMPEEINRVATDSISDYFFATTATAVQHLQKSGVGEGRIFWVGNPMADTLLVRRADFYAPPCWQALGLQRQGYLLLTLHRPHNVDAPDALVRLLHHIVAHTDPLPVVFVVHPRTQKHLSAAAADAFSPRLHLVPALSYLPFHFLMEHARGVITDSGGISEETSVLGVPCLTVRDHTERPETVALGTNETGGTDPARLAPLLQKMTAGHWKKGQPIPLWDGGASRRIVAVLQALFEEARTQNIAL